MKNSIIQRSQMIMTNCTHVASIKTTIFLIVVHLAMPVNAYAKVFTVTGIAIIDLFLCGVLLVLMVAAVWFVGGGLLVATLAIIAIPLEYLMKFYRSIPRWVSYPIVLLLLLISVSYSDYSNYVLFRNGLTLLLDFNINSYNVVVKFIILAPLLVFLVIFSWLVKASMVYVFRSIMSFIIYVFYKIVIFFRWLALTNVGRGLLALFLVVLYGYVFHGTNIVDQYLFNIYEFAIVNLMAPVKDFIFVSFPKYLLIVREQNYAVWVEFLN